MAFREVDVVEIREVLRGWLDGGGLRTIAERAGVDRKTSLCRGGAGRGTGQGRRPGGVVRRADRRGGRAGTAGPPERATEPRGRR